MGPKLPEFKTPEELAEFFETHSTADYWDEFEDVPDVEILIPRLHLPPDLLEEIKRFAESRRVSYHTLVQQWLEERLRQEEQAAAH
ncbi:MAG: hypothetical protein HY731_06145 [Candidatus Tectomicrobia bacterium]|nr:hypothetical protein [Candidatus Tectomicrobia bacterium]